MKFLLFLLITIPCFADWTEIRSPHFTIITETSAKKGQEVAHSLEQVRAVFANQFPQLNLDSGKEMIVFVTEDWQGLSALIPDYSKRSNRKLGGMFNSSVLRNYMFLRLDSSDYLSTIYHEYTHYVIGLNYDNVPVWLNEGLAEFFGELQVFKNEVRLGSVNKGAIRYFTKNPFPDIAPIAQADRNSPLYNEANKASSLYKMAWQITHYAFMSEKGREGQYIFKLLDLAQKGVPSKQAMEAVFGDLNELKKTLKRRWKKGRYPVMTIKTQQLLEKTRYEKQVLTQEQVDAHLGAYYAYSRNGTLDMNRVNQLMPHKDQPGIALNLGIMLRHLEEPQKAQKLLQESQDQNDWITHYIQARLADDDKQAAAQHLDQAIQLNPGLAHLYFRQSIALVSQDRELALRYALRTVQLDRGSFYYRQHLARVLLITRRYDHAIQHGQLAMLMARTDQERDRVLKRIIEPAVEAKGINGELEGGDKNSGHASNKERPAGRSRDGKIKVGNATFIEHDAIEGATQTTRDGVTIIEYGAKETGGRLESTAEAPTLQDVKRNSYYQTPLMHALWEKDEAKALALLKEGRGHDEISRYEERPLHLAAERGYLEVAKQLLAAGAEHSPRDKDGFTPLILAARAGHVDVLQLLHEAGADLEATDNHGTSALMWAGFFNRMKPTKYLLNKRASKTQTDKLGHTAIDYVDQRLHRKLHILMYQLGIRPGKAGRIKNKDRSELAIRRFKGAL